MIDSRSLHLVDPALRPLLALLPDEPLNHETLLAHRERHWPISAPDVDDVSTNRRCIPGPTGAPPVEVVLHVPARVARSGAILHIHGGGLVMGRADPLRAVHRLWASRLSCVIASVDYRLAPETCFPGAIEDCYAALGWLMNNRAALGVDDRPVCVMGESAGGGLAAALALLARDRGEHRIDFQQLIYPMLDDRTGLTDVEAFAGEFVWTAERNRFGWSSYLGAAFGTDDVSPYAAAARATDVSGLPPTFIAVGALDLFVDENMAYANRLLRAGVTTELHVYPGAFHGFNAIAGVAVSEAARRDSFDALQQALS